MQAETGTRKLTNVQYAAAAALLGLVFVLYGILGNAEEVHILGRSAFAWMVSRWNASGGDQSYAWFIPFVTLYVLWQKRAELRASAGSTSALGFAVVILALALHVVGVRAQQTRISLAALIALLWGIPFCLYGWRTARALLFPAAYLAFCIPLGFLNSFTVPLRLFASSVSVFILNGLGIAAAGRGTVMVLQNGATLDVADACSGLRSLLVMMALTTAYAWSSQDKVWKMWVLFAASVPIAVAGNVFRIVFLGALAAFAGQETVHGVSHDASGMLVFVAATFMMIVTGEILRRNWRGTRCAPQGQDTSRQ